MPSRYDCRHTAALAAADTSGQLRVQVVSAAQSCFIYEIVIGATNPVVDGASMFRMVRGTVVGTGTTLAANKLDQQNHDSQVSVIGSVGGVTKTANSSMMVIPLNARANFRWIAKPGAGFLAAQTAGHLLGLQCDQVPGGSPDTSYTLYWEE